MLEVKQTTSALDAVPRSSCTTLYCTAAYPSAHRSRMLARQNLHLFRHKNTRFDVIGGVLYFCLVVSAVRPVVSECLPGGEC